MKKLADFALHALQWEQSAGRFYISILFCSKCSNFLIHTNFISMQNIHSWLTVNPAFLSTPARCSPPGSRRASSGRACPGQTLTWPWRRRGAAWGRGWGDPFMFTNLKSHQAFKVFSFDISDQNNYGLQFILVHIYTNILKWVCLMLRSATYTYCARDR